MADKDDANHSAEAPAGTEAEGSSEQGGFSEAFAERSAPAAAEEQPSEKAAETAATAETPAAKAGDSEAPSTEGAEATSGTGKPDPWGGLTPEQLEMVKRLEQSDRSNRGRVGALTKQLNQRLEGTRQPPEAKEETRDRSDDDGSKPEEGKPEKGSAAEVEARLKAVTDEYGDILGPVPELIADLRKEVASLKASDTRKQVDQDAEAMTGAYAKLEEKHPDFREYNESNEKFVEWFTTQPKGVQALINSLDPEEVSLGLQLFKTDNGIAKPNPVTKDEGEGGDGDATGDRRERQLQGLKDAPDKGAPATAGTPNEFGAAFQARAKSKAA
jgi:hypothetical protein